MRYYYPKIEPIVPPTSLEPLIVTPCGQEALVEDITGQGRTFGAICTRPFDHDGAHRYARKVDRRA